MHFVTIFHKLSASPSPTPHFCSVTTTAPHRQKNTTTKLAFVVRDCTKTRNFTGHLVSLVHNSDRTYRETMLLYAPNPTPPHHAASVPKEAPLLFPFRRKRFRRKNCTCIVMQSGTVRSHGEPSSKQYLARKHQLAVSQQLESETAPATLLSGNQIRGYETGEDSRNGWVVTGMCIREVRLQHTNQTTSTSFCGRWRGGTWMYCAGRSANKKSLRFLGGKHKEKRFKIKFTIVWPTRPPRHHTHPIIIVSGRNGRSLRASSVVNQLCNRTDRFIFKSSSLSYWC